ncbi:MAG: sigma 54-interacting transcriptional regulator [Spirochaetales bacterium]|jgi:PAS domain S-box-containing protein|nr:sigma 54-interacting transcriptional regulator [Spirochaetales bacterium]
MVNITFIVPYPELLKKVETVIAHHELSSQKEMHVSLTSIEYLRDAAYDSNCDVLIARGFATLYLQHNNKGIPVVEIPMTTCDIIRAAEECVNRFQARHIALIGPGFPADDTALLDTVLSCSLTSYAVDDSTKMEAHVRKAVRDGCDAIIGGNTAKDCAIRVGCPAITIQTGEKAIRSALNEAVRVVKIMRRERERAEMFTTISNCSKDGIIYVANDNIIRIANPASMQILGGGRHHILGDSIARISRDMQKHVEQTRTECREISNHLYKHCDNTLSVNYFPVMVGDSVTGVVVTFQDVTRIQQVETHIRQKLSEKGLVSRYHFSDIIHKSKILDRLIELAQRYAAVSSNVLIEGETGTGKELLAQSIHNASSRSAGPFVAINCAAIPENLLESEMFGYEEGAFTGTSRGGKTGLFELAHNGTLFLDEVSGLPFNFQGKLLRVLQEREVRRVGANKVKSVDVRIIAASNFNLQRMVQDGDFRKDLFYRLDVLKLFVPPLSSRPEDIEILFLHFIAYYNERLKTDITQIDSQALELLSSHRFEGNVRELKNIAERVSILCMGSRTVQAADIRHALYDDKADEQVPAVNTIPVLHDLRGKDEQDLILNTLRRCANNQTRAARELGIDRTTLWRKLRKYNTGSV